MKKIAFLVLVAVSISAHAEDYERHARKQGLCDEVGKFGPAYYDMRLKGIKYEVGYMQDGSEGNRLVERVAHYGYYEATSAKDAYLVGWGMCMDAKL